MKIPSNVKMAWRNLGRNRRRTFLALLAITTAQFVLVFYEGILTGYLDWGLNAIKGPLVGDVQVHAKKWRDDRDMDLSISNVRSVLDAIQKDRDVREVSARIYAPVLIATGSEGHAAVVMGLDLGKESGPNGVLAGVPAFDSTTPGKALVGTLLGELIKAKAGASLAVIGQGSDGSIANELFQLVPLPDTPVDFVNRMGVILPLSQAQELFVLPDQAHEIVVRAKVNVDAAVLARRLSAMPELKELETLSWQELVPEVAQFFQVSEAAGFFILFLVFVTAAAGIANTMLMATFERTREFGMLLALGVRPVKLVWVILLEAVYLGIAGVALGTLLGFVVILLARKTGFDLSILTGSRGSQLSFGGLRWTMQVAPRIEPAHAMRGILAVGVTAVVATLWPAIRVSRLNPAGAMRA